MNDTQKIIEEIDESNLAVCLAKEYYQREAVFAAAHKFTDICTIKIEPAGNQHVGIYFKEKGHSQYSLLEIAESFCNEAIEQQLRLDLEAGNGQIRALIVEQAFKPLENLKQKIDSENSGQ